MSTLRLINADILKRETSAAERVSLNDADILDVIAKMIKQRRNRLRFMRRPGAPSSPRRRTRRSRSFPPTCRSSLSDIEAGEAISALIKELEAATLKDMGRTMTALKERFAGQMDFGKASAMVKKLLWRGSRFPLRNSLWITGTSGRASCRAAAPPYLEPASALSLRKSPCDSRRNSSTSCGRGFRFRKSSAGA